MTISCESIQAILVESGAPALQAHPEAQKHLVECTQCFSFLESLQEVDATITELPPVLPPKHIVSTLLAQLPTETSSPNSVQERANQIEKKDPITKKAPPENNQPITDSSPRWLNFLVASPLRRNLLTMGTAAAAVLILLWVAPFTKRKSTDMLISPAEKREIIAMDTSETFNGPSGRDEAQYKAKSRKRSSSPARRRPHSPPRVESGEEDEQELGQRIAKSSLPSPQPSKEAPKRPSTPLSPNDREIERRYAANTPLSVTLQARQKADQPTSIVSVPRSGSKSNIDSKNSVDEVTTRLREQQPTRDDAAGNQYGNSLRGNGKNFKKEQDRWEGGEKLVLAEGRLSGGFYDRRMQTKGSASKAGQPTSTILAKQFLESRTITENVPFVLPTGYWQNTYVPGDPAMRLLRARLARYDRTFVSQRGLQLDGAARQYAQTFDPPSNAALSVYLHSDQQSAQDKTRMLVQVGLQSTPRFSGRRPEMSVGVVLDLREPISPQVGANMRALVFALQKARESGDQFSLTIAGRSGGVLVPPGSFRHGPVAIALRSALASNVSAKGRTLDLVQAIQTAANTVATTDNSKAPLGSSLVLVVTPNNLSTNINRLVHIAHGHAVNGIPMSVVGVGGKVDQDQITQLALAGQGNRRFLSTAADAKTIIEKELLAVAAVVARAIRLRVRLAPGVKLVDVLGSQRLDAATTQRVRDAERSIDLRVARNLGVTADRGNDEDGIQIVIPTYYAGDAHVVLLDVVAPGPGPIADVSVRYKDLVFLRNGIARASVQLARGPAHRGPIEWSVIKNLLAHNLGTTLKKAGQLLATNQKQAAVEQINAAHQLLEEVRAEVSVLAHDRGLARDIAMLTEYQHLLKQDSQAHDDYLADSLHYAGVLKTVPKPKETE